MDHGKLLCAAVHCHAVVGGWNDTCLQSRLCLRTGFCTSLSQGLWWNLVKNYLGRIFQILVKTLLPLKVLGVRPITAANTHELEILSSTGGKAMLAHFFCHIFCRVCHQVSDGMLAWKRENFFVSVLTVYGHIFEMAGPTFF